MAVASAAGLALAALALAALALAAFALGVTGTIFSHKVVFPRTLRNCGWLMQVVNHLVTLVKTFLSGGSNA